MTLIILVIVITTLMSLLTKKLLRRHSQHPMNGETMVPHLRENPLAVSKGAHNIPLKTLQKVQMTCHAIIYA